MVRVIDADSAAAAVDDDDDDTTVSEANEPTHDGDVRQINSGTTISDASCEWCYRLFVGGMLY